MSLFGSIRMANNALHAQQIGLQVVGQNISNANTPGYIREEAVLQPATAQRQGNLTLGLGVQVAGVIQKIDKFLEQRLRNAASDAASSDVQQQTSLQLEGLVGELGDADLSSSLNAFFSSVSEVLNQPESDAIRNLAVLQGGTLTSDIRQLAERVVTAREDIDDRIAGAASDINRLTDEIFTLNRRIAVFEAGDVSNSDAVGLRDQRGIALSSLAELVDIKVIEQDSGVVNVFVGGDFLVNEVARREVTVVTTTDRGQQVSELQLVATESPLEARSGLVTGLTIARDDVLGGFLDDLDEFAGTLAFEFNRLHSSGQGLTGHQAIEGEFRVDDTDAPLDAAGLAFTPQNGSFQVLVRDRNTGLTETTDVVVDLNGLDSDSSLEDIVTSLNAISGISVSITSDSRISIQSDSPDIDFSFAEDTSGLLAALGVNNFFSGSTSRTIGVRDELQSDARLFAASRGGIGEDTDNAVLLAGFIDQPLDSVDGSSINQVYGRMTANVTQSTGVARAVAEGDQVFYQSLETQKFAITGVNIDDEIVKMISYQRAYQASARYISELNALMDILVNL